MDASLEEMTMFGNTIFAFDDDGGKTFKLRMVNSKGSREKADMLVKKMYSWRGYEVDAPLGDTPNMITLVADTSAKVTAGTMTLYFDSAVGLPADEIFRDKLDELRARGCKLCEPSRLAVDKRVPKWVFASMFHVSYLYALRIHGFTDYVIEINPRHVAFYKCMLGFEDFGEERNCSRVNAPAVLLRLDLAFATKQIEKFGGLMAQHGKEKSLYPYFFPLKDEPGLIARLVSGRD